MRTPEQPIGAAVRQLRLERGFTQEDLAFEANVTVSGLARIEQGRSSPMFTTLVKLADALKMRPHDLVHASEREQILDRRISDATARGRRIQQEIPSH